MDNLYSSYKRKEVKRIYKNGEEITKNISYILQFTDSTRFMASSMLNLVNNLSEGVHRIKCKLGYGDNKRFKIYIFLILNIKVLKMI